jgi:hypothetical protein
VRRRGHLQRATITALGLQAVVFGGVFAVAFQRLWYGLWDISDITIYFEYAQDILAKGMTPYKVLPLEYPPLALPFITLPWPGADFALYRTLFSLEMIAVTLVTAVVVVRAAAAIWPRPSRRPLLAGVGFAGFVAAMGSIVMNRFDIVIALVVVATIWLIVRRQWEFAALVLGLGFAVKLTPAVLVPVLPILLGRPLRRWLWPATLFVAAATLPFVPWLITAPAGIWHVFTYHLDRPLQIESVLGTPLFVARGLGRLWIDVSTEYGSQAIVATGAGTMARLSGPLTAVALLTTYWFVARPRALLRAAPRHLPLAVLAVILAFMAFGKVLSPQFFIWILPVAALVILEDRLVGGLALATVLLTQIEFPALYWDLVYLKGAAWGIVVARNVLLLTTFGVALWRLWRLPAAPQTAPSAETAATPETRPTSGTAPSL